MTVLSAQTIEKRVMDARQLNADSFVKGAKDPYRLGIHPFIPTKLTFEGMSYGLTAAGYDIRLGKIGLTRKARNGIIQKDPSELMAEYESHPPLRPIRPEFKPETYTLDPGEFLLCASLEEFEIPYDLQAIVHDKSTLARQGIALQNTVLEPGWKGFITLELSNHGPDSVVIRTGQPIAQVVFHLLDVPTDKPYMGKYQNQGSEPTAAILEKPVSTTVGVSNTDYLQKYVDYLLNTGKARTGLLLEMFDEDWDPIGPNVRRQLNQAGFTYEVNDRIYLKTQGVLSPRDLEGYPTTGGRCSVCNEIQYDTPSGEVCKNGHGGS